MTDQSIARAGTLVVTVVLAAALTACGPEPSPRPSASGTAPAASSLPGTLGPPVTLRPGATPLVRIDPSLLAVLPASIDDLSVLESSEVDADAASNASLALVAEAAVGAFAVDAGPGDFVVALVVRLKPGALDDAGFRNWRDAYDAGACQGSGVGGHGEATIGGRTVFVGTCANGNHTYHAWLPEQTLLISASSWASSGGDPRRLGEVLFENLRP